MAGPRLKFRTALTMAFVSLFSFALAHAESVSLIEFNTWGVPFASKDTFRYQAAMKEIAALAPDFVVLEEVFSHKGRKAFHNAAYPYEANGPRAIPSIEMLLEGDYPRLISSGLRILSKYPIEKVAKLEYRSCKKDDCLSRKGAVLALVRLPSGRLLNLVATHLNARGEDSVRQDQLDQLKTFMDYYSDPGAPTLLAGDFNFNPTSPLFPKLVEDLKVVDTWTATHDASDPGLTYDSELNHYAREYALQHHFPLVRERIDLLLVRGLTPRQSSIIFDHGQLLSDHFGLHAEYELDAPAPAYSSK